MNDNHHPVEEAKDMDLSLICDFFLHLERQGPGSPEATLKALSFVDKLTTHSLVADMGCGTGCPTLVLAQSVPGQIRGVDFLQPFIDRFTVNVRALNLQNRVKGIAASMDNLPFEKESLDLIWSEGAIYNIGFERGLQEWYPYLKRGGYMAVSEVSWLTEERPQEIHEYWTANYAEIDTMASKVGQMQRAGFMPIAAFVLPENCWTEHYYRPMGKIRQLFLDTYSGHPAVESWLHSLEQEEEMYNRYKDFYSYVFYIGKKLSR